MATEDKNTNEHSRKTRYSVLQAECEFLHFPETSKSHANFRKFFTSRTMRKTSEATLYI